MLNRRFPVTLIKGAIGLCLAVLLIAPVAVLWSVGPTPTDDQKGGTREPISVGRPGEAMPPAFLENELYAQQKFGGRARYERPADNWPAEMGSRRIGHADITDLRSADLIALPGNRGFIHTKKANAEVAPALKRDPQGPARKNGEYYVVQLGASSSKMKNSDLRKAIADTGAKVVSYVPNNAFVVRVNRNNLEAVKASGLFQYVSDWEPAYRISPNYGQKKLYSAERAASRTIDTVVRLFPGEDAGAVVKDIERGNGQVRSVSTINGDETLISAKIDRHDAFRLAKNEGVRWIEEERELRNMTLVTSAQTEVGRLLDDRIEGKIVRPFNEDGIDGGGQYVTNTLQIPGCSPWTNGASVDPACYLVQPQFVGLVDNGISMDAAPLSHSTTAGCTAPGDCSGLSTGGGVGSSHRKVEVYVTSRDLNHDLTPEDATAEGDFLSCDSINSGGDTHGQIVAATMLGNPSDGQFGLGFKFEDVDQFNEFFSYFNDTNEDNLPMDGQARGARLLFVDAQNTPGSSPPPCATNLLSDVNVGASTVDEVEALVYRRDLSLANSTMHARGAQVVVLPYGSPTDFNNNVFDGQGTYAGDAEDLDAFLFSNRRVLVAVPVGNDGANPDNGSDVDPKQPSDPNDSYTPDDIQVSDLATGKNIVSVGGNATDTLQRSISPTDGTEFMANFTSKGPSTFTSDRMAPLVVAPATEPAKGGGGREGEYTDDFFSSHAIITSFDNDQSGSIEVVRNQRKLGTSFSAGKVGGAAAQVRDYFAKGYYPTGLRSGSAGRNDVSGALVKAILVASADFLQSGPLIANCTTKFCIEQGYGKVEIANALPLKTYTTTRRPADATNLSRQPDVPSNILVADELWDGGLGYGVVALGDTKKFRFRMSHGGGSLRAALAWYDKEGETLVNNLNLEVRDGDFDNTAGSCGERGRGICGGMVFTDCDGDSMTPNVCCPIPDNCGFCIADDQAYFDPNNQNDYFRRHLGNNFRDRQQFSAFAGCDSGTGLLDPLNVNSQYDTKNTTEMVYLYHSNPQGPVAIFGDSQGSGSEGFFEATVSFPDGAGVEVGAPNTPCIVINGSNDSTVGGNDAVLTTRDGVSYIASGVDNAGTPGVDEAQCDSTVGGDDTGLIAAGLIGQPFGLVVTGPIVYAGSGRSLVELDKSTYDCSDTSLRIQVTENTVLAPSAATVGGRTVVRVLNSIGVEVDREEGIAFANRGGSAFRLWQQQNKLSELRRVQYIGGRVAGPIRSNGIVEVDNGQTIRVDYNDADAGDTASQVSARVTCQPIIGAAQVGQAIENFKQHIVQGGCDLGRATGLRGDYNMDAKERLQYQLFFTNHSRTQINNLKATLACDNLGSGANPCQYVQLLDSTQNLGRLPFGRQGGALFNIQIDENVVNLATADRVVELVTTFTSENTDFGTTLGSQVLRHRVALQADNERLFYSSDRPSGGKAVIDYTQNGLIETAELNNGGRREEREVRTYQTWAGTTNAGLLTACGGGSCVPFNFDNNDGGFTGRMTGDSKRPSGYPASQGWFYGTGGGCGWQTQQASAPFNKGVWHAGAGGAGVGADSSFGSGACGSYVIPADATTSPRNEFVRLILHSPVFNKVNQGTDVRGFSFDARMENLAYNSNEELRDASANMEIELDTNRADDGPAILGDTYSYRPPFSLSGPRTNTVNGARHFGPRFDFNNSTTNINTADGDEVGISSPLASYDGGSFLQRPFLAYPAADSDGGDAVFTADERISNGSNCGSVPVGQACRAAGFTTASGPVRNRDIDTGASFEDFNGASGNSFQFELAFTLTEGGTGATGWTVDDAVFEWSEQHPADQATFAGGDCSLNNTGLPFQGTCVVTTCSGGPRDGLFCRVGHNDDCRTVAVEGTCSSGTCTVGRVGLACGDQNDCDLGSCVAGNTALGCAADGDCNRAVNDCDSIPFRISTSGLGSSSVAGQCAVINWEKLFAYDCTSSIKVTVQDPTPKLCTAVSDVNNDTIADGCTTSPRQVLVNARTNIEALGEFFRLTETAASSGVFSGDVILSGVSNQPGILVIDPDPGERVNMTVSYDDPECDLDADGQIGETNFLDIDGDGVRNFGVDGVLKDQDPVTKRSDDDNCFDALTLVDVFNPVMTAQLDNNADGFINASDCVDGPLNRSNQCDFDDDGLGDICDNCPIVANSDQLDTDADGIGNGCEDNDIDRDGKANNSDNCVTVYNPTQTGQGGGQGGNQRPRGELCDRAADIDGDGVNELTDNCPNEQLVENGTGGFAPGPCPGGALDCTYNPDQRDTDNDGVGDICDHEDFDNDSVLNNLDNCRTVYNPTDTVFFVQADSDGDGRGDDRTGRDTIGVCQAGNANAGARCIPVGTAANCITGGTGAFCIQSSDAYCDFDSQDDNNSTIPDDLVQFTSEINCQYAPGGLGSKAQEVGAVTISAVAVTDDGTADPVCTGVCDPGNANAGAFCVPAGGPANCITGSTAALCVGGDPFPLNNNATVEGCGTRANSECDTPGFPGTGVCTNVPDGINDAGELSSVRLTVANQTADQANVVRTLTNSTIGVRSLSATIGCIPKSQVFVGTLPTTGTVTTPAGGLTFVISTTTGQSTAVAFTEAEFEMTLIADGIEANTPPQTFKIIGDSDQQIFGKIAPSCGDDPNTVGVETALGSAHFSEGILCEDFDTERNATPGFQWQRNFLTASPTDPLFADPVLTDDVLGSVTDGGAVPFGTAGLICSADVGFAAARATCHVVISENDWHLHSPSVDCDPSYDVTNLFSGTCAPDGGKAHSGTNSMHMGRHLSATSTLSDTYRMRQTSAFVMDPVNLGTGSTVEFWHIYSVCDDICVNAGAGGTTAGGQLQVSLFNAGTGLYERWQRLSATQNGYDSLDQEVVVICEFDPGDDLLPPTDETMCGGAPQWARMGDPIGTDPTCVTDTDGDDPTDKDCGSAANRTRAPLPGCSWVSDPICGNFLENGNTGVGVWVRSQFNLSAFSGRQARLRWISENGGGWGFGESRSFLEPEPGFQPSQVFDYDDGWFVDDIRVSDLRVAAAVILPDPTDGLAVCPSQGDTNNCGVVSIVVAGAATDARTGRSTVRAQNQALGMEITLDARQSTAADDPGTVGTTEGACTAGVLQYKWERLSGAGAPETILPFSPKANVVVSRSADTTYRVTAFCSSDASCTSSREIDVQVYTGDGADLNTSSLDSSNQPIDGLRIDESAGTVTLTWRSRPQPTGVSGFDVFKRSVTASGTDIFLGNVFASSACLVNAVANSGTTGALITRTDTALPATGAASLYMISHSSNNTLAINPLGYRPSTSNRSGQLVSAAVTCP